MEISVYRKNPGWNVMIDEAIVTNIRVPNPEPEYDKTHDLPPGETMWIEHAVEGFDSSIRRRVFKGDGSPLLFEGVPMDLTLRSSYLASRDRYQVGVPKTEPLDTPYDPPDKKPEGD